MKINKSFEFSLKLMVLIMLISFLIFDFLLQIYSPKSNLRGIPTLQRIEIYYAFFTTQSNYVVVIFLFFALFTEKNYNRRPSFGIELAVTVYITITMLVFWFGLLASPDEMKAYNTANWISTVVLHLLIPIVMIGNFIVASGDFYFNPRHHTRFGMWGIMLYPLFYFIYAMVRGDMRFKDYGPDFFARMYTLENGQIINNWTELGHGIIDNTPYTGQMWYPYWFLNVNRYELKIGNGGQVWATNLDTPTWVLWFFLILAFIAITSLVFGLQFLYLYWNNSKFYRWHDINEKLISKEEHDYRVKVRKLNKSKAKNDLKLKRVNEKAEYFTFKKSLKTLSRSEKNEALKKRTNQIALKNKLEKADILNQRNVKKQSKRDIRSLLWSIKTVERGIVRENLKEAERYKKLVKKGVLISKTKFE
ncbi:Pr6Pr family membrane protein [Spiroplasma culicicola]|uniref:Transmembrane protein n=1 Tax=Spiroplasma culicicola AES-1 TaxID=1276246 RepID=W6AHU1_9MOLU|nr:Pr6Pr family membrane protein [Spiroplasma culicicola]AHI53259.1 hypothetical protein SCULI_v1c09190 [Spiroplasma culicicola AES-1]